MQCPSCRSENREGRRFCAKCGVPLALACPACGFVNDPGDEYCGGCGAHLADAPATEPADTARLDGPSGEDAERRQVTILFADLSGFTKLTSARDPEETHRLMGRFFESVDGIVESFGGTVDKHIGDSVMALFGAPVAHGNDPERAVRAAADIHAAMDSLSRDLELALEVHIGIASGHVVASGLGSGRHREYTVLGDSVNLAARLVEMAGPGETLIADAVYRALAPLVEAESVGAAEIKGLDAPVKVWRPKLVRSDRSAATPFVGRRAELRQLRGLLDACREDGSGHTIYVRGETRMGKSRLVEELAAAAAADGFSRHTGLVLDFGVGRGRDAVRGLVRSLLGIAPGTAKKTRAAAGVRAVADGLIDADHQVFLNDLLDVPQAPAMRAIYDAMDNDTRIRRKQECVGLLLERASRQAPLLIIVEDLHWADPPTLGFLAVMAETAARAPMLLVMTSRIEGDPLDAAWRQSTRQTAITTIDLGPLRPHEALALAGGFVEATDRFAQRCVERAEGNPMFLEQLLRSLEDGDEDDVPGSVQSIVLARVDRLSADDKHALQSAAVLGQRFVLADLRVLLDDPDYACDGLMAHHLLRPAGGDFLFSHALIWESVYASLLRARRQELHRTAATWFADREPALRAEHLERAGDSGAAGAYFDAAAAQAEALQLDRALELVERGVQLALEPADTYRLLMLRGECLREIGRPTESIDVYRQALEVASADHGLDRERSEVHYYRGNLFFPLGNIDGCLEQHRLALEFATKAASPECEARALSGLGDAYYSRGRMVTALDYFRRCIAICREHGFGRIEVGNQYMVAWNRVYLNEVGGALDDALAAVDSAVRVGHRRAEMVARLTAARVLVEKDEVEAARPYCDRGLELADSLGANRFKPFLLIYPSRIRFAAGGVSRETVRLVEDAVAKARDTGIGFLGPWVLSTLALVTGDRAQERAALAEGEEILAAGCVGHNYFGFYRDAIDIALRNGAWDEAERYVAALTRYTRAEPVPWADFFAARGGALAAHGRDARDAAAIAKLAELRGVAEDVGLFAAVPALDRALTG